MFYLLIFSLALFVFIIIVTIYQRYQANLEFQKMTSNSKVIQLTDADFEQTISEGVTLVDFWAPWCGPCRSQAPLIEQIAIQKEGEAKVCKMNVDDHKKAAIKMKIKNIPNIIIFSNGKAVRQLIGSKPRHLILKALDDTIAESGQHQ